jgi:hypothetical protein
MTPEQLKTLIQNSGQLDELYLGTRTSRVHSIEENVTVSDANRAMHTLSIGPTGSGKTQEMIHAALQDAQKDNGFCMIIPKGNALTEVLAKLPEDRLSDVHYVNPEMDPAPGINVLEPHITVEMSEAQVDKQKDLIVSDLLDLFRRQSESWGDRFGRNLEALLRAHIELNIDRNESNTLLDVYDCVTDDEVLGELIDRIEDHVLRKQLRRAREEIQQHGAGPIERRLSDFTGSKTIRNVVGAKTSAVDFKSVIDGDEIVLVDIQKGVLSDTTVELIGSIVITQIWAAAQSRIKQPVEDRELFTLYVDELPNFAGEGSNFAKILAEAREYRLGCWVATQYLRQLDTNLRSAVVNNCRTKMVFEPSDTEEFSQLASMFRGLDKAELGKLGDYRAAVQIPSEGERREAVIIDTYPPWTADRSEIPQLKEEVAAVSTDHTTIRDTSHVGKTAAAGGDDHFELLEAAKHHLEQEEGVVVELLNQDGGSKPDGRVMYPSGELAHLEAEHSTLSKPVKVLKNYLRAAEQDREVLFAVKQGESEKLGGIVSDPVNRRGDAHEDDEGRFDYYRDENGEPFTEIEKIADGGHRVVELSVESDCPMLDEHTKEELRTFCVHRDENGHCEELDQPCVLLR